MLDSWLQNVNSVFVGAKTALFVANDGWHQVARCWWCWS